MTWPNIRHPIRDDAARHFPANSRALELIRALRAWLSISEVEDWVRAFDSFNKHDFLTARTVLESRIPGLGNAVGKLDSDGLDYLGTLLGTDEEKHEAFKWLRGHILVELHRAETLYKETLEEVRRFPPGNPLAEAYRAAMKEQRLLRWRMMRSIAISVCFGLLLTWFFYALSAWVTIVGVLLGLLVVYIVVMVEGYVYSELAPGQHPVDRLNSLKGVYGWDVLFSRRSSSGYLEVLGRRENRLVEIRFFTRESIWSLPERLGPVVIKELNREFDESDPD